MGRTREPAPERLPRLRAAAQLLHRPLAVRDPVEVARATAGIQAQDGFAARLSFRSRSRRLRAADVDRARTAERSLLRTWMMRMTIHLIPADDAGWMLPLFEPRIERWSRRRLEQLGIDRRDQERALAAIGRALGRDGPLSRAELSDRVTAAGVELDAQTRLHTIGLAVSSGLAFMGPDRGADTCLVRREDWLEAPASLDRDAALCELARRYLRAFGPASDRDLAHWSGLGLTEVRSGLERIAGELEQERLGDQTLLTLRGAAARLPRRGQLRMLGAFDTYLLGYRSRDFAVGPAHNAAVKAGGGGWIRPVIVRDGVVIGGWRSARRLNRIEVELTSPLAAAEREAVDAELDDISRFEGAPVAVF